MASTGYRNLIERYRIQHKIGSGGAASVYQAFDPISGRTIALKILHSSADGGTLSRFQREAATVGRLRHPNIVQTLDVNLGEDGGAAYIAMELVEGESLAQILNRVGHMSPQDSCRVLAPVARALAYAHRQGIVHRDVKPSNILLRPVQARRSASGKANTAHPAYAIAQGNVELDILGYRVQPLLSDFGIARALDAPELTHVGRTVGTPAFMSPEQCAGSRQVDGKADIYSLGAVLFRCLAGRPPFRGATHQVLHAHVYSSLAVEDEFLHDLPPGVVTLLQRSLAKEPKDRFQDADAMAALLIEMAAAPESLQSRQSRSAPNLRAGDSTQTLNFDAEATPDPADATQGDSSDANPADANQARPGKRKKTSRARSTSQTILIAGISDTEPPHSPGADPTAAPVVMPLKQSDNTSGPGNSELPTSGDEEHRRTTHKRRTRRPFVERLLAFGLLSLFLGLFGVGVWGEGNRFAFLPLLPPLPLDNAPALSDLPANVPIDENERTAQTATADNATADNATADNATAQAENNLPRQTALNRPSTPPSNTQPQAEIDSDAVTAAAATAPDIGSAQPEADTPHAQAHSQTPATEAEPGNPFEAEEPPIEVTPDQLAEHAPSTQTSENGATPVTGPEPLPAPVPDMAATDVPDPEPSPGDLPEDASDAPLTTEADAEGPTAELNLEGLQEGNQEVDEAEGMVVVACTDAIDEFFLHHRNTLDTHMQETFDCPDESATLVAGDVLRFENGLILQLAGHPLVYILYTATGEWEQTLPVSATDSTNSPDDTSSTENTIEDNDIDIDPRFRTLWQYPPRRAALGRPLHSQIQTVPLIVQRFRAGLLIGEIEAGEIYTLHRDRLRF